MKTISSASIPVIAASTIRTLRAEAGEAGDLAMVSVCDRALARPSDVGALLTLRAALRDAAAQA